MDASEASPTRAEALADSIATRQLTVAKRRYGSRVDGALARAFLT